MSTIKKINGIFVPNTFVTGFTYNDANLLTISQNGRPDLNLYLNQFSGISINGLSLPNGYALSVTGDTIFNGDVYVNGDLSYNGNLLVTGGTTIQNGLTANTIYTDYIDFNTTYSGQTLPAGRLQWDDGNGTLVLGLKGGISNMELGLENMALCYNADSVTLTAGTMVYVSGSQGNRPAIKRALATSDGYSVTTLGMVSESIASGAQGFVTTYGMVNNLGTYGLTGGTALWLSPTIPGGYTDVKPQAPNHTVLIGYVVRVSNNPGQMVGSVFVNISNGWELDELHDVRITGATEGDLLIRSSYNGSSVWVNSKRLNGNYTISGNTNNIGSLSATTFYGSGLGLNNIPISGVTNLQTTLDSKFSLSGGTVTGDVLVLGNVTILGTATTINTQTLSIADNIITLNSNVTGGTPFVGDSGIEVLRGSATTATILWKEQNLQWEAGLQGTTKRIILEGDSLALLTSGHTHPISDINNLQTTLNDKLSKTSGGTVLGFTSFNNGLSAYTSNDEFLIIPFKSVGFYDDGGIPIVGQTTIGGYFESSGGTNSYSLQLKDGTQGLNKVLVSKTTDGKANWSDTLNLNSVTATTYYGNFAYVSNIIATNSFSSNTYSTNVGNAQVVFSNNGSLSGTTNLTWSNSRLNINGGLNVTGNTLINGSVLALNNISANTKLFIITTPTSGITSTQILMRNSTTGEVEITDNTSPNIFNYGLANAMINLNFLT